MKKIFALALAAIMTASMATVAFAAPSQEVIVGYDEDDAKFNTFYTINSDNQVTGTAGTELKSGARIATPLALFTDADGDNVVDSTEIDGWYTIDSDYNKNVIARADWKVGEAEVSIEKVKFADASALPSGITKGDYVYCLVVTMPENMTNKTEDVAGTVKVGRTTSSAKDSAGEVKVDFAYYADATLTGDSSTPWDGGELTSGETGIVTFDKAEGEIDIDFEDVATFTVDVTGQGKLNLAWNTDFDKEFGAMYDYANLSFLEFEGTPSFNKNGILYIYAEDENTFVYEAAEDGAKAIDATWNEDYGAWEIKTRKLTKYVISDVELDEKTVTEDGSSSTTDGGKDNPDTGR